MAYYHRPSAASHKIKNVRDKLPNGCGRSPSGGCGQAYHAESTLQAEGLQTELPAELDKTLPGAATSLREGMFETLTSCGWACRPPWLARCARPTPVESMIEICQEHSKNVKQ